MLEISGDVTPKSWLPSTYVTAPFLASSNRGIAPFDATKSGLAATMVLNEGGE